MPKLNISSTRSLLQTFGFHELFIEELGWSQPSSRETAPIPLHGIDAGRLQIAELGGIIANLYELTEEEFEHIFLTFPVIKQDVKDVAPHIAVSFHDCGGEDVCRLTFKQAHRPVFVPNGVGEAFYVRTGNSKRRLSISEAMEYCRQRWPG